MAHGRKIAVIGLGYVGLPVRSPSRGPTRVIGYHVSPDRIAELRAGRDRTGEVVPAELAASHVIIIAVPRHFRAWARYA